MSTELVLLAVLMGAATWPSRGLPMLVPGIDHLPARARAYLELVGPAILATLAAVNVFVVIDAERNPSFHVGIEWLAVSACVGLMVARRGLLVGTVVAALIAALARASGFA